jgi:dihydrodipicolinate synthase/N-acetylneuraminate lyase
MGDAHYARVRPPLVPLTADQQAAAERAAALCLWEENAA